MRLGDIAAARGQHPVEASGGRDPYGSGVLTVPWKIGFQLPLESLHLWALLLQMPKCTVGGWEPPSGGFGHPDSAHCLTPPISNQIVFSKKNNL